MARIDSSYKIIPLSTVSVSNVTEYYRLSANTTEPFDKNTINQWSTTPSAPTSQTPNLLNAELISYTDGSKQYNTAHVVSKYTKDGRGIAEIKNAYRLSAEATPPTKPSARDDFWDMDTKGTYNAWGTICPATNATYSYLWNCERIKYSDNSYDVTSVALNSMFSAGLNVVIEKPNVELPCDKNGRIKDDSVLNRPITTVQVFQGEYELQYVTSNLSKGCWTASVSDYRCSTKEGSGPLGKYLVLTGLKTMGGDVAQRVLTITGKGLNGESFELHATQSISLVYQGIQGESGAPLKSRGEWQPNTDYEVLDVVHVTSYQKSYVCKTAHKSGASFDVTKWNVMNDDGQQGPEGFSPTFNVSTSGGRTIITLTDRSGTTTGTVTDGTNGQPLKSRGEWSVNTYYKILDVVHVAATKKSYICKGNHFSSISFDPSYWDVMNDDGNDGAPAKQYYIHFVYNNSLTVESNYSTTQPRKYMGVYTDDVVADAPTFADANAKSGIVWSKVEGVDGVFLEVAQESIHFTLRRDGKSNYEEIALPIKLMKGNESQEINSLTISALAGINSGNGTGNATSYSGGRWIGFTPTLKTDTAGTAPSGIIEISVTSNSLGTFQKKITITSSKNGKYLGRATAISGTNDNSVTIKKSDNTSSPVAASVGDFITWIGTESSSRHVSYNYQYIQTGISSYSWAAYSDDEDSMTAFSDIMSILDDATNPNVKTSLLVQRLVAAEAFMHKLFVNKIRLMTEGSGANRKVGAIHGGKYDQDGNPSLTGSKGVYMDADGEFKCINGTFEGEVNASSGNIGGIQISENGIQSKYDDENTPWLIIQYKRPNDSSWSNSYVADGNGFYKLRISQDGGSNWISMEKYNHQRVYFLYSDTDVQPSAIGYSQQITANNYPTSSDINYKYLYVYFNDDDNADKYYKFITYHKNINPFFINKNGNASFSNLNIDFPVELGYTCLMRFMDSKRTPVTNGSLSCSFVVPAKGSFYVEICISTYSGSYFSGTLTGSFLGNSSESLYGNGLRKKVYLVEQDSEFSSTSLKFDFTSSLNNDVVCMVVSVGIGNFQKNTWAYETLLQRCHATVGLYSTDVANPAWKLTFSSIGDNSENFGKVTATAVLGINSQSISADGSYDLTVSQPIFSRNKIRYMSQNTIDSVKITPVANTNSIIAGLKSTSTNPTYFLPLYFGNLKSSAQTLSSGFIEIEGEYSTADLGSITQ